MRYFHFQLLYIFYAVVNDHQRELEFLPQISLDYVLVANENLKREDNGWISLRSEDLLITRVGISLKTGLALLAAFNSKMHFNIYLYKNPFETHCISI